MITHEPDREKGLTVHVCLGQVTLEELVAAIRELYATDPTADHLWDLNDAQFSGLRGLDVQTIADLARSYAPTRVGGKTAIVSQSDVGFGLARMYEVYAESAGQKVSVQAFRSLRDAHAWLGSDAASRSASG